MAKKNEAEIPENTSGSTLNNFFQGTKEELEKVVWPSRKQLVSESAAVYEIVRPEGLPPTGWAAAAAGPPAATKQLADMPE